MNCKTCNNGLDKEEEWAEQCWDCAKHEMALDDLTEYKSKLLCQMIGVWELNGEATRHLLHRMTEELVGK